MEKLRVTVTPHKISVFILIRIYGEVRLKSMRVKPNPKSGDTSVHDACAAVGNSQFRRNYCMLLLNLIQGPDMSLTDLCMLLLRKEKVLFPNLYASFHRHIRNIVRLDIEGILELVSRVNLFMSEPSSLMPIITKTSVLGLHIRRTVVLFEKLSCSGVVEVFKAFKLYSSHAENLGEPDPEIFPLLFSSPLPPEEYEAMVQSHLQDDVQLPAPFSKEPKDSGALWTRRQAELFLAQQSSMILKNEATAMPVEDLHNRVQELLNANPDCSEAYFLSYLNFLRVRDFCGALHSLYHCFDRGAGFHVDPKQINVNNTSEDKARSFRYGALNLAMFYAHFGHKKEALLALNECVMLAHGSSCNFCLQHALCWLYRLCDDNKEVLMERSIARSNEFNLSYLSSLGIQSLGQLSAFSNKKPCLIFEMLTKSDILNCQHSMLDLAANSYTLKSTLWSLYGRPAMSGLHAQLLLHSEAQDVNSEATCLALCQLAAQLMAAGEPHMTASILWHTRERFPQLSNQHARVCCEQVLSFEHLMRQGLWQDARRAAEQLAATDQWESLLRLAELQLMQGDQESALQRVNTLLEECSTNNELSPNFQVRATVLAARVLGISSTVAGRLLVAALAMSESRYLSNLNTVITLKLAEHQLLLGLPAQALCLVNKVVLTILSHGSVYEQGQALLLQVKCRICMLNLKSTSDRTATDTSLIINALKAVRIKFEKSQAIADVREVSLLQAVFYHQLGMQKEKLKLALELRLLDEQIASRASSHV